MRADCRSAALPALQGHLSRSLLGGGFAAFSTNERCGAATGAFGAFGFFGSRLPRCRPLAITGSYIYKIDNIPESSSRATSMNGRPRACSHPTLPRDNSLTQGTIRIASPRPGLVSRGRPVPSFRNRHRPPADGRPNSHDPAGDKPRRCRWHCYGAVFAMRSAACPPTRRLWCNAARNAIRPEPTTDPQRLDTRPIDARAGDVGQGADR